MSRPQVNRTVRITGHPGNSGADVGKVGTLVDDDGTGVPYRVRTTRGESIWAVDVEEVTVIDPLPGGKQVHVDDLWDKVMAGLIDVEAAPEVVVAVARVFRENT